MSPIGPQVRLDSPRTDALDDAAALAVDAESRLAGILTRAAIKRWMRTGIAPGLPNGLRLLLRLGRSAAVGQGGAKAVPGEAVRLAPAALERARPDAPPAETPSVRDASIGTRSVVTAVWP